MPLQNGGRVNVLLQCTDGSFSAYGAQLGTRIPRRSIHQHTLVHWCIYNDTRRNQIQSNQRPRIRDNWIMIANRTSFSLLDIFFLLIKLENLDSFVQKLQVHFSNPKQWFSFQSYGICKSGCTLAICKAWSRYVATHKCVQMFFYSHEKYRFWGGPWVESLHTNKKRIGFKLYRSVWKSLLRTLRPSVLSDHCNTVT